MIVYFQNMIYYSVRLSMEIIDAFKLIPVESVTVRSLLFIVSNPAAAITDLV